MYDARRNSLLTTTTTQNGAEDSFETLRGAISCVKSLYGKKNFDKRPHPKLAYIHTAHVMRGLPVSAPYYAVLGALLHDVVEDGHCSIEDLEKEGVPAQTLEIVTLLTRRDDFSQSGEGKKETDEEKYSRKIKEYDAFIKTVAESGNYWAIAIKIADIRHNTSGRRTEHFNVTEEDAERLTEEEMAKKKRYKEYLDLKYEGKIKILETALADLSPPANDPNIYWEQPLSHAKTQRHPQIFSGIMSL